MREIIKCPAHQDNNPSCLHIVNDNGRQFWKCYAGCSGEKLGQALGLVGSEDNKITYGDTHVTCGKPSFNHDRNYVINLDTLAADKGLSADVLASYHCYETSDAVVMDYVADDELSVKCSRHRYGLAGKTVRSSKGSKPYIYGEWLAQWNTIYAPMKGGIFLVEGESDCWTLWNKGFLAYGIPGATNTEVIELKHVACSPKVYIWCEPDNAGKQFVRGCVTRLKELNYAGKILILDHDKHKDPNAWHKADAEFAKHLEEHLKNGVDPDAYLATPETLTEIRLSEKVASRLKDTYRYISDTEEWLTYDGGYWKVDDANTRKDKAIDIIRGLKQDAMDIKSVKDREDFVKQLNKFEKHSTINAITEGAGLYLTERMSSLDNNPYLFNCVNGTLDLSTGILKPHDPNDLLTQTSNVVYDPSATCPTIDKFLNDITLNRNDLKDYLMYAIGLSLTAIPQKVVWFLNGERDSGKTTFINLVRALTGDYSKTMQAQSLIKANHGEIRSDIFRLRGSRLVLTEEVPSKQLDIEGIKNLTGCGRIAARPLYGKYVEFNQTWKVWMEGNNLPMVDETEEAIWNRLTVIPFNASFPKGGANTDSSLGDKMRNELSGLLNLCVAALLKGKQVIPSAIESATNQAIDENSLIGAFLDDCTSRMIGRSVSCKILYLHYVAWCKDNNHYPRSSKAFGGLLTKRHKTQRDAGKRNWMGLILNLDRQEIDNDTVLYREYRRIS